MNMLDESTFAIQLTISNIAAIVTIAAFLAGLAGIWFTARQSQIQANSQKLTSVIETNNFWTEVTDIVKLPCQIRPETLSIVRRIYDQFICDRSSSLPQIAADSPSFLKGVPFVFTALFPSETPGGELAPDSQIQYERQMLDRAFTFSLIYSVLTDIGEGRLCTFADGYFINKDQSALIRDDLRRIEKAMDDYVGEFNNLAELYEVGLTPRRLFLGKRHVAIVQQIFAAEPYILWRNSIRDDRWGMRLLGLGEAARTYHWKSHLHSKSIALRGDPPGFEANGDYIGHCKSIGVIISPGQKQTTNLGIPGLRMKTRVFKTGFRVRDKRRQSRLRDVFLGTRKVSVSASEAWQELARSNHAQERLRERLAAWKPRPHD